MCQLLETINASSKRWCYQIFNIPQITERHKASSDDLQVIVERFPKVILDVNALESKLLECQAASDSELPSYFDEYCKPIEIDLIWHQIYKLTKPQFNQPQFKNLSQLS